MKQRKKEGNVAFVKRKKLLQLKVVRYTSARMGVDFTIDLVESQSHN